MMMKTLLIADAGDDDDDDGDDDEDGDDDDYDYDDQVLRQTPSGTTQ